MRVAFHTSCNEKYLPGLKVLIKGIRRTLPDIDIIVTSRDLKDVEGCQIIPPDPMLDEIKEYGRWNHSVWYYMNAASLTEYDRVVMVGCDQLITGDISEVVQDMPEYGALVEHGTLQPQKYKDTFDAFCTGMMIITPGNLSELVNIANECEWGLAEQTVWNEWAYRNKVDVKPLPEYYDLTKRSYICNAERWNRLKDKAISVHFVGPEKPWLKQDPQYQKLDEIWHAHSRGDYRSLPCAY